MRAHVLAVAVAMLIIGPAPVEAAARTIGAEGPPRTPATAAVPSNIRPEHARAGRGAGAAHAIVAQEPAATGRGGRAAAASALAVQPKASGLEFLTRPYIGWHSINSVFDHCNPDYSIDGRVCRFDGTVALRGNGVDPSFSSGYAMTPGGGDYLYYDGHNGWDYGLAYENVLAAADGTVKLAGSDSVNPCFGQTVIVEHPNGYSTRYAHLSSILVSAGQSVRRGQVLAVSGNTGCSSGPHLHFGVYATGSWTAVDPWGYSGPGADPWPADPGNLWLTDYGQYPIPFAPADVTAMGATGNSATIAWTAPSFDGGTPIANYTIAASPGGATAVVSGSVTTATIGGLANGTTYTFTVTATNAVGSGPASAPSGPLTISPFWAATYDTTGVPKAWAVNQTQPVTVKLTNAGSQTWPAGGSNPVHLAMHFATAAGGWPKQVASGFLTWVNDQRYALPADVAPGASVTMTVPVAAPVETAASVLEAELVREGQLWFSDWAPVTIKLSPAQWAAGYDVNTVPRNWAPGQTLAFRLKLTNNGNQAWPAAGSTPVHLGVHFANAPGGVRAAAGWLTDQRIALPGDLPPGGVTTVTVTATAPASGSAPVLELEMVKEMQFWFDAASAVALNAGPPSWTGHIDLRGAPSTWTANQVQTFSVTVTNTGNQLWPAGGASPVHLAIHFATDAGGWPAEVASYMRAWLNDQRYVLPSDVAPGASVTWNVTASAPATAAPILEAELVKEQQFWFSTWTSLAISPQRSVWSSSVDLSAMPQNWAQGQRRTFPVTLNNTGNQSWPAGGANPVRLGAHFASSAGGWPKETGSYFTAWLTDDRIALPADVQPGAAVTIPVTLTAPASANAYVLEFELVREGQFWFKDWSPKSLLAGPALWQANYDFGTLPASWTTGQAQTISVRVTNTGNQIWPAGGAAPVHLGLHFATSAGGWSNEVSSLMTAWLNDERISLPADLPPGASATLSLTVTPPAGSQVLEVAMVKEQEFWFADWANAAVAMAP